MQSLADWVAEHYGPADVLLIGLYRDYYERARAGWQRRARAGAGGLPGYQDGPRGQWRIKRSDVEALVSGEPVDAAPRLASERSVRLVAELTEEQIEALRAGSLVIEIRPARERRGLRAL
jgi:hypothetical protein